MSHLPIPLAVVYAGLVGTLLSLLVATATNKWSLRVFFLLALRLAIGWHFLFEGMHKIHSHYTGPTETNRPFTSEPYFRVAPGPLGEKMRKEFGDPAVEIMTKIKTPRDISRVDFAKMSVEEQAAECPDAVAKQFDALEEAAGKTALAAAEKELKSVTADETKALADIQAKEDKATKAAKNDEEKTKAKADADQDREKVKAAATKAKADAQTKIDTHAEGGKRLIAQAKAKYARWVFGVDTREAKVKFVTGDLQLSGLDRIDQLEFLKREARAASLRQVHGLGNGTGTEVKRAAEFRMDAINGELDLVRDMKAFIAELKKDLNGGKAVEEPATATRGQFIDRFTMWFLVVVGSFLLAGFLTRLSCLLAAGFLIMTYLAHPAFPWYPLPPNTEGNPVFVNKNIIECLALFALACYPTGRWLGLDAIVLRPFWKYKGE